MYFFASDMRETNVRTLYNILDLLSDFGGLYTTFIISFFYYIGTSVNNIILKAKLIRSLFYVNKKDLYEVLEKKPFLPFLEGNESYNIAQIWNIKFNFTEKLNIILNRLVPCLMRKQKDMMRIYNLGQDRLEEQFNLMTMNEVQGKVKASLIVLVGDD